MRMTRTIFSRHSYVCLPAGRNSRIRIAIDMFQKTVTLIMIFIAIVIQVAILPNFFPSGAVPNLILVVVIIWTIRDGFERTLVKTILAGFFLDFVYHWTVGINISYMVLVSFAASSITKRFLVSQKTWRMFTMALLAVLGSIAADVALIIFGKIINLSSVFHYIDFNFPLNIIDINIIIKAVYSFLIFLILYWPINQVENFLAIYDQRKTHYARK
jgi:rod shape-determining protein MreD